MKKEIIINATSSEIRVALLEDGRLAELFLEVPDKERHVGSIYLGRVQRVVQGMNAAFVDIGHEQDAFLHFSDAGNAPDDFVDDDDDDDDSLKGSDHRKDRRGKRSDDRGKGNRQDSDKEQKSKARPDKARKVKEESPKAESKGSGKDDDAEQKPESESRKSGRRRGGRRKRGGGAPEEQQRPEEAVKTASPQHSPQPEAEADAASETEDQEQTNRQKSRRRRGGRGRGGRRDSQQGQEAQAQQKGDERPGQDAGKHDRKPDGKPDQNKGQSNRPDNRHGDRRSDSRGGDRDNRRPQRDDRSGPPQGKEAQAPKTAPGKEPSTRKPEHGSGRGPDGSTQKPMRRPEPGSGGNARKKDHHSGSAPKDRQADERAARNITDREQPQHREQKGQDSRTGEAPESPSPAPQKRSGRRGGHRSKMRSERPSPSSGETGAAEGAPPRSERTEEQRDHGKADRPQEGRSQDAPATDTSKQAEGRKAAAAPSKSVRHSKKASKGPARKKPDQQKQAEAPAVASGETEGKKEGPPSSRERAKAPGTDGGKQQADGPPAKPTKKTARKRPSKTPKKADGPSGSSGDKAGTTSARSTPPTARQAVDKPDTKEKAEGAAGSATGKSTTAKKKPKKAAAKKEAAKKEAAKKEAAKPQTSKGGETPPPAKTSKKKSSPRRKPRGGSDEGNDGGKKSGGSQVMDAKLPTFQTKRSGEVTIALERNQELLVQVTRESYASKGVRVSTKISLPGRFLVLLPLDPTIGISRKVVNVKERRRLRKIARSILPEGYGCIIRTVAQDKDSEVLGRELQRLVDTWREIEVKLKDIKAPAPLYHDQSVANTVIRDLLTPDINRVVIDNKSLYQEITEYVEWAAPDVIKKIKAHPGPRPIFDEYGIEQELEKLFEPKVYLPSGGYIILEQTEAMMVIDVNSGRFAANKEQELNSLQTNMESAREIARQLRLRDIGGLIVVDFIDLYDEKNRKKIYDELKKEMRRDRAKSVVLPMTQFGLVQMTRQRVRQQIVQTISEPCPVCSGSGFVASKGTMARKIERWLQNFRAGSKEFRLTLHANAVLVDYLTEGDPVSRLTKLMLKHFVRIKVVPDESLAADDFRFYSVRQRIDITDKYVG